MQKDLVASVEHSVLEDRISEAVCIVADTERWSVNVSSSMREQPKPLSASHLVINMVEAVSSLSKLKMSPEFVSNTYYQSLLMLPKRLNFHFDYKVLLACQIFSNAKLVMLFYVKMVSIILTTIYCTIYYSSRVFLHCSL